MAETTQTTPRQRRKTGVGFRLLILHGPDPERVGRARVLGREPTVIGREPTDDGARFQLEDGEVSRSHARVEWLEGAPQIVDLESHNGTFVNRERVETRRLQDGDVVRIGAHLLLCQALTPEDSERLVAPHPAPVEGLVGTSHRMLHLRQRISAVAAADADVLILGESGVGKELVARGIHAQSGRRGPFVAANCTALPEQLAESELFGHARGAFTGAAEASKGLFGEAEGGTLLLDEIGDMPLPLQPKLLRALASRELRRLGEDRTRKLDVKVLAATHVGLPEAVDRGTFRGDLFARLMGLTVHVPTLRERSEDILPLLEHFMRRAGLRRAIDTDAAEALLCHPFRFNVRELEQVAAVLSAQDAQHPIRRTDLPPALGHDEAAATGTATAPLHPLLDIARDAVPTGSELERVLSHFQGSVAKTAEFFGKARRQIYRWAERAGIDPDSFRE